MNETDQNVHLNHRRNQAAAIKAEPHLYKVCDQCRSISYRTCNLCPVCHGYRWVLDEQWLLDTANIVGSTPFPLTAGVVPRFLWPVPKRVEATEQSGSPRNGRRRNK